MHVGLRVISFQLTHPIIPPYQKVSFISLSTTIIIVVCAITTEHKCILRNTYGRLQNQLANFLTVLLGNVVREVKGK